MFKFNIFLFEPVCHFLKLSRVIEASMIWGYVHCALPRSDIWLLLLRSMNNTKLRFSSPEIQEQFLTIIDKVRDCKQTRQHMKYALFASFFFSLWNWVDVVDRGFLWRKLKVARTLCVQQRSLEILFDSIAVPPLPPETKKYPTSPQKNNTATANRLKSWNLE